MIEIGPGSQHELSIEETFLYCITIFHNNKNDWRLPSGLEADKHNLEGCWRNSANDNWASTNWEHPSFYFCTPVRTIND